MVHLDRAQAKTTVARRSRLLLLGVAILGCVALGGGGKPDWGKDVKGAINSITKGDLIRHVSYLASDELEGRAAGQPGGKLAGEYIAKHFQEYGLEPGGVDGTFFQPVPLMRPELPPEGRNIIGIYRGSDEKLKDEAIIIGAHYDHIGRASHLPGLTRGRPGQVHNGADDNASGTAGLLEVAAAFTKKKLKTKRTVIFMSFDGEEVGLLGSKKFVEAPTWPLDKIACMLNIDMIARNKPTEMYFGKQDRFMGLNVLLESVASRFHIFLNPEGMDQFLQRSDQWSFMERGIPACFVFGGMHPQYHTEHDDVELIMKDPNKIVNIAALMLLFAYECANHDGLFDDGTTKREPPKEAAGGESGGTTEPAGPTGGGDPKPEEPKPAGG